MIFEKHNHAQILNLNNENALKVNYLSYSSHIIKLIYIYTCSAPTINHLTAHAFKGKLVRLTKFQQLLSHIFVGKAMKTRS